MKHRIETLKDAVGETIKLSGWAYNFRSSGKIFFLQLRDGTGFVQVVFEQSEISEEAWNILQDLRIESSVTVHPVCK